MSNTITNSSWNPVPAVSGYANQAATAVSTQAHNFATNFNADNLSLGSIGSAIGSGIGGGVAAFFQARNLATGFSAGRAASTAAQAATVAETGAKVSLIGRLGNGVRGMLGGLRGALPALAKGTGIGAAVSGVVSAGINGFRMVQGEITGRQFAGEVAADTVTGAVSSLGGLGLAAGVTALAGTVLGGLPLAILGVGAGIAGSLLADRAMSGLGIRDGIRDLIAGPSTSAAPTGGTAPTTGGTPLPPPSGPTAPTGDF